MRTSLISLLVCAATLGGCAGSNETEIRQWMADVRQSMKPSVEPVPPPKEFTPFTYESRAAVDPFDAQKVVMAVARQQQTRAGTSTLRPDLDRRREVLEGYSLDQIRMVGMMKQTGKNVALLEAGGTTHLVRVGSYIGQNFGLVTRIAETDVQLKEIVQDAAGEWVERPSKLELQEGPARPQGSKQ